MIDRKHHEEIDRARDDEERDEVIQKIAIAEDAAVDSEGEIRKVRCFDDGADEGSEQILHQGVDDTGESRTYHQAHRQINNISSKDELFEIFEHGMMVAFL